MQDLSGVKIYIEAFDVWDFFEDNRDRLGREMVNIAENADTEYAIYLEREGVVPFFKVFRGDQFEYGEVASSGYKCREICEKLYRKYLFPVTVESTITELEEDEGDNNIPGTGDADEEEEIAILDDIVYERDDELNLAAQDFLSTLLGVVPEAVELKTEEGFCEKFLEKVCELLASEYNISVYHPKWIEDKEENVQHFHEYPYLALDGDGVIVGDMPPYGEFSFCDEGE